MSEMGAACLANDFRPLHAVRIVFTVLDGVFQAGGDGLKKTRPAAARFKLRVGFEKGSAAAHAHVFTVFFKVPILAGESAFRAGFLRDSILLVAQAFEPKAFRFVPPFHLE